MKLTTSILALLVLFLSTQAVFIHGVVDVQKAVAKKTCCAKKMTCKKNGKKKKDKGCKEGCNPFMACYGCSYILTENPVFPCTIPLNLSVKNGVKQDLNISGYNADCWHPPKIV